MSLASSAQLQLLYLPHARPFQSLPPSASTKSFRARSSPATLSEKFFSPLPRHSSDYSQWHMFQNDTDSSPSLARRIPRMPKPTLQLKASDWVKVCVTTRTDRADAAVGRDPLPSEEACVVISAEACVVITARQGSRIRSSDIGQYFLSSTKRPWSPAIDVGSVGVSACPRVRRNCFLI